MALNNACRNFPVEQKAIEPEMLKVLAETEGAYLIHHECGIWRRPELTQMPALPPNDLPSILRRESVYCALGRLSRAMASYGGVDFNAFLQQSSTWLGQGIAL